ncbi:hypothetical protein [Microbacterium testaceum]|uniref:Uncharacterized protein n=1 Tax=Microbacterium testaceum TaxID=2033 RepID=A0A2T7VMU7_MICTE|nr:hypothetical protein [Microbacterium testaceum]PVE58720.1 hypothetical protein DC432_16020 [Microbacterium testaceum]
MLGDLVVVVRPVFVATDHFRQGQPSRVDALSSEQIACIACQAVQFGRERWLMTIRRTTAMKVGVGEAMS